MNQPCHVDCDEFHHPDCPNKNLQLCVRCDNFAPEGERVCDSCAESEADELAAARRWR